MQTDILDVAMQAGGLFPPRPDLGFNFLGGPGMQIMIEGNLLRIGRNRLRVGKHGGTLVSVTPEVATSAEAKSPPQI